MAAYCNICHRYVNQYCDRCGGNSGITSCEMYGCGGMMICPLCGNNDLSIRKGVKRSSSDEKKVAKPKEEEDSTERTLKSLGISEGQFTTASRSRCPICGFDVQPTWKYCPECGIRFSTLSKK